MPTTWSPMPPVSGWFQWVDATTELRPVGALLNQSLNETGTDVVVPSVNVTVIVPWPEPLCAEPTSTMAEPLPDIRITWPAALTASGVPGACDGNVAVVVPTGNVPPGVIPAAARPSAE